MKVVSPKSPADDAGSDRGAASISILFVALLGLLFAAALHGGGTVLAARAHAAAVAQSAARAGAQQIDLARYRVTGQIRLDHAAAARAAAQFLADAGAAGTIDVVTGTAITVTAVVARRTPALRVVGRPTVTVTATATAVTATGLT
ncbi:hypothetical protein [Phytohabitans kaempferiae]|uniref:Flp pilus-assembly TadG-like N-terminal domain-containing protein n=1 Tax=Phytohabitans kaempferiae TaxID=1620943 RepID=A0ABV6M9M6_9ACTN